MDMTKIVTALTTAAEEIEAGQGGAPMLGFVPQTKGGKVGYDHVVDAMNRLPRPLMALGTLAVFGVASVNPLWFEARMQALSAMPQPMWWLLGAVITMFFGARETHYIRTAGTKAGLPAPTPAG